MPSDMPLVHVSPSSSGSAYTGGSWSEDDLEEALEDMEPFVRLVKRHGDQKSLVESAASRIAAGEVVGWCQGR